MSNYSTGPQDGKPFLPYRALGENGNFTIIGFSTEDGDLLYRDEETGATYCDGENLTSLEEENVSEQELAYLEKAGFLGFLNGQPILAAKCEKCGKEAECVDTRDIDEDEYTVCRDCAMDADDGDFDEDEDEGSDVEMDDDEFFE